MSRVLDVETLIEEVKRRPALYSPAYANKNAHGLKAAFWKEIGKQLIEDWRDLNEEEKLDHVREIKKKWKSLRDQFVREMKTDGSSKRKSPYMYSEQLQFLAPHLQSGGEAKVLPDYLVQYDFVDTGAMEQEPVEVPAKDDEVLEISFEPKNYETVDTGIQPTYASLKAMADEFATTTNRLTDMLSKSMAQNESDQHGNRSFLLSLLPIMDSMSQKKMLETRIAIMDTVKKIKKK